jgi:hypothetical protein
MQAPIYQRLNERVDAIGKIYSSKKESQTKLYKKSTRTSAIPGAKTYKPSSAVKSPFEDVNQVIIDLAKNDVFDLKVSKI